MAVGVERRAKKVAAKLDHALLLQPVSNAMSYNPLVQPPGSDFPVPETTTSGTAEDRTDYYSAQTDQAVEASPQEQLLRKRRASKDKTSIIRRSSSTPHMRNLTLGTTSELSPTGDKRRNKLGYHRTSVACGHCRRRKIRCLVANDEPTGRCANCIRLKKECNFYPVDQAPESSRAQASAPKEMNTGALPASTTSSPRHPVSMLGGKVDEFRPPFPGAVPTSSVPSYEITNESDSETHHVLPTSGMPVQQPAYGYPHPIDTQWPPSTAFLPSSAVSESPASSAGYWHASPTTAKSAFGSESNVSGIHTPATMSTSSTVSYGSHPDNQNWGSQNFQPPSRSMSYGNIEGLPQHFQNHSFGVQPHEYRRTAPYQYPTTIDTSSAAIHSTALGPHTSAPLSAPIVSGNPYNYPPPWNQYSGSQNTGHEGPLPSRPIGGQWYAEPGQLSQVQEEGAPPTTYGHHGMPHF